jgi:geranylgeranyl reductase family protein
LPHDALIIGAGPAGSAAALVLARAGRRVIVVDRHEFPRDKVCGDALIPDALEALARLGLLHEVRSAAHWVDTIRIYAPNLRYTTINGECACLPRLVFDDLVRRAAVNAGAEFVAPARVVGSLTEDGEVTGACFEHSLTHRRFEIRAATTILATGAAADVLKQFKMCLRSSPSATAARLYVRVNERTARQHNYFCIAYASGICPGYGWFFPGPERTFNVGVGYVYNAPRLPRERNVRKLLEHFVGSFPAAASLMRGAEVVGPLKGAPLRTAMQGALVSRPGVLVVGEGAGLTYSFTGEGIGKAMQSGIMAAEAVIAGDPASYAHRFSAAFAARFKAYRRLQTLVAYPMLANLLIWRANAGTYVHRHLEELLNEQGRPDRLVTLRGAVRALIG